MADEKEGALAPEGGVVQEPTPLSEIVDKPRLTDTQSKGVTDEPVVRERKPKAEKPDDEARFRGLLNETLSEREKRQAAEAERDRYKQAWDQHQRKLAADQEKDPAPDQFRDPQAYTAWVERQISKRAEGIAKQQFEPMRAQTEAMQLRLSEMTAKDHLGPEKWTKLNAWIEKQDDQFKGWAMSQPDPYFAAYEQYRQRTTFEALGNDDLDSYIEKQVKARLAQAAGPIDAPDDDDFEDTPPRPAPRSFAGSRSQDPSRDPAGRFSGPKPLGAILNGAEKPNRKKR